MHETKKIRYVYKYKPLKPEQTHTHVVLAQRGGGTHVFVWFPPPFSRRGVFAGSATADYSWMQLLREGLARSEP